MARLLDRAAIGMVLVSPVFLMHGRAIAEILFVLTELIFLAACARERDWSWLRRGWVPVGLAWWVWLVICSAPGIGLGGEHSFLQALAMLRWLLLIAALQHRVLRAPAVRRWLQGILAACAAYIALQSLLQFATGRNLYGDPRGSDGELTGPFDKARAAAPLSRLLFPTLLPPVAWLLARGSWAGRIGAAGLSVAGVAVMVLIGQRMPLLLTLLGLLVSAVLLPGLRRTVLVALVAGAALIAASVVVSPPSFYRLVTKFSRQMEGFPESPYGELAARAVVIAEQHPWTGRGFDGFRTGCPEPRYFHPMHWGGLWPDDPAPDGGGAAVCNEHPHNHYLQAVTDSGLPGLVLFSAMVLAWLAGLGRGLWRNPDPLRVGLFVAAFIHEWPIASASSFEAVELSGFFFVMLGWGLAESRYPATVSAARARGARIPPVLADSTSAMSPSSGTPRT
jgi:O-antigen ligase